MDTYAATGNAPDGHIMEPPLFHGNPDEITTTGDKETANATGESTNQHTDTPTSPTERTRYLSLAGIHNLLTGDAKKD